MELTISIIGASVAVLVSLIGAWLTNYNMIRLQTRKLKEQYYIDFVIALQNHFANNKNPEKVRAMASARNVLVTVASTNVINKIIDLEEKGFHEPPDNQNEYLTELMKAIRTDLKIGNNNFPTISFKKSLI